MKNRTPPTIVLVVFTGVAMIMLITYGMLISRPHRDETEELHQMHIINRSTYVVDLVKEYRPPQDVIQYLKDGKVARITYSFRSRGRNLYTITLKDGTSFNSGPTNIIDSEIRECGKACEEIRIIEEPCVQECF